MEPAQADDQVNKASPPESLNLKDLEPKQQGGIPPLLLIILGVLELLFPAFFAATLLPQLLSLQDQLQNPGFNPLISIILMGGLIFLFLFEIMYGMYLLIQRRNKGELSERQRKNVIIILLVGIAGSLVTIPIIIISIIKPIHTLLSSF